MKFPIRTVNPAAINLAVITQAPQGDKNENQNKDNSKTAVNEGGLEQCLQKSTSEDLIEKKKATESPVKEDKITENKQDSDNLQDSGIETLESQVLINQSGIK